MGRSVSWETKQKLFSYEISLRNPWGGRIQAEFSMNKEITRLREAGLGVYAGVKQHIIEGGVKAPEPWLVAYLVIHRDDESIKASPTNK
jgi:hypothetical protein